MNKRMRKKFEKEVFEKYDINLRDLRNKKKGGGFEVGQIVEVVGRTYAGFDRGTICVIERIVAESTTRADSFDVDLVELRPSGTRYKQIHYIDDIRPSNGEK